MNRLLGTALHLLALAVLPTALLAAPAQATQSARPDAAETARCISQHLPRGAQVFRAADGSFQIVAFGPRTSAARWIVRKGADGLKVSQTGGTAGTERALKGVCY